jgi:hypothetical protein
VDSVYSLCNRLVDGVLLPFDYLPDWLGLILFSVLSGIGILWVFGRLTNQEALQLARDRMSAAVYEIRLFPDSPRRIVASQGRLVVGTGLYVAHALPALIVLLAPLFLLTVHLEVRHGLAPLDARKPTVVRMVLQPNVDPRSVALVAEGAVKATAPPVFVASTRELYLRVTPPPETQTIKIKVADEIVTKELTTTPGARYVNADRNSGPASLVALGREAPLPSSGPVERVSLHHASRSMRIVFPAPWWVHWLLISTLAALALRKRLGIVI